MTIARRQLLNLSFLRQRKRPTTPAPPEPAPPAAFSLDQFYQRRAADGTAAEALPPIAIRVLPEDFEVGDE